MSNDFANKGFSLFKNLRRSGIESTFYIFVRFCQFEIIKKK
jgi:hypothetical protein